MTVRKPVVLVNNTPTQLPAADTIAKASVGLGNVDNTSDAAKPISTATQSALDAKQPLDSDLTAIAALAPANGHMILRAGGVWTSINAGLGITAINLLADIDSVTIPNGFWGTNGTTTGTMPPANPNGTVFVRNWSPGYVSQHYVPIGQTTTPKSKEFIRVYNIVTATWTAWSEVLNSLTYTDYTVTKAGTGATGTWNISITGTAASDSSKQGVHVNLTALSGLTGAADKGFYFTAAGAMALYDLKSVGRTFLGATTIEAQRTALELTAVYTNLTLVSPFIWDSAGDAADYHPPSYAKVGDTIRMRGKVTLAGTHTTSATVNVKTVATLPVGFRPAKRKAFQIFWDTDSPLRFAYCLVFVNTDGTIVLLTPDGGQTYPFTEGHFPLDQIWYDLAN